MALEDLYLFEQLKQHQVPTAVEIYICCWRAQRTLRSDSILLYILLIYALLLDLYSRYTTTCICQSLLNFKCIFTLQRPLLPAESLY